MDMFELYDEVDDEMKKEHTMIKASNKAGLTMTQLIDINFEDGLMGVYNLGMKHMYEYLKGEDNV